MAFKENSINQAGAGTKLYDEGDTVKYIYMLVKGRVELVARCAKLQLGAGSFMGINGLAGGRYTESCRTIEDAVIYVFEASESGALTEILEANRDYNGIAIYYQNRLIMELNRIYKDLQSSAGSLYRVLKEQYDTYISESKRSNFRAAVIPEIPEMAEFDLLLAPDEDLLNYYLEFCHIAPENTKNFFSESTKMTLKHLNEQFSLVSQLEGACCEALDYVEGAFKILVASPENSLYRSEILLAMNMTKKGFDDKKVRAMIETNVAMISEISRLLEQRTGSRLAIEKDMLEYYYTCYMTGTDFSGEEKGGGRDHKGNAADLDQLAGSAEQIAAFAELTAEKSGQLFDLLDRFESMEDRESQDDEARRLRKQISECFYDLYKAVFKKAYGRSGIPKAAELFLDYGFISERLLDSEQLAELLELRQPEQPGPCEVYTVREWLTLVYDNKKEPSKNDMGQDYSDVLRTLKRQNKIDEAKEKEMLRNSDMRLEYELKNLFMPANRIVNGQLSIFVPWLYSEPFYGSVSKAFIDRQRVNDSCSELLKIDYSIFHRDTLYVDAEAGIEREYVMKQVMPVFILFPTVGTKACMWQEITGRYRDSEARMLMPLFTYSNPTDLMTRIFGQYRWAYCKTEQGTNWNNIQYRSLTSEYSDYIQFYKKNRLLSEERKEKIKLQIQRGRNNLREIFVLDYEAWLRGEAGGSIRLNKVAREIMATYCPFSREIRQSLIKQPLYEEAYQRFIRERARKTHELELRYRALEKKNAELPDSLLDNLDFYKNM